jgi:hypothetical protein
VKLSDSPETEELLIWCDYLEETHGYPPEVILWLRHAITRNLRPWKIPAHTWDLDTYLAPNLDPEWYYLGELPEALWSCLQGPVRPSRGSRVRRRRYDSCHDAWEDLAQAVARLATTRGLDRSTLGDAMYPLPAAQEVQA